VGALAQVATGATAPVTSTNTFTVSIEQAYPSAGPVFGSDRLTTVNSLVSAAVGGGTRTQTEAASGSDAQRRLWLRADAFFEAIDDNGDGQISFDELEQHLSGLGFKAGAIDHIFDLLDISRDGLITKEELRQTLVTYEDPALRMALGLGAPDADDVFDEVDVNGDGEISRAELAAYLELNSSSAADVPACARTIFKALDINGDGSLSREELRVGFDEYTEFRRVLGL
jgi:hypothetical protein